MHLDRIFLEMEALSLGPLILLVGNVLMTGAGWWCQVRRYPAMLQWTEDTFRQLHSRHTFQISLIVMPGMLFQVVGAVALHISTLQTGWKVASGLCLVGSLLPTFLVSGPIHHRLSKGKEDRLINALIGWNLPRTSMWTLHLLVAIGWMVVSF